MWPAGPLSAAPARQGGVNNAVNTISEDELRFVQELAYCDALEPEALRDELNRISQTVFAQGEAGIDLDGLVQREWNRLGVDGAIDRSVTDAINQARTRTDWLERFLSGWSVSQAEALTREVATLAFTAPAFNTAMDQLAEAVAVAVADEFARLSAESAAQTTFCLQRYIGGNYSQAFVAAFSEEIRAGAAQADLSLDDELDSGLMTILGQHRAALGGVGVIIAGQIAGRMVQRIGQDLARRVAGRIAGRVLGRVGAAAIPAIGWVVGIGLIVYDLAEGRDGALPQIQASLQSEEVKATIRSEIVTAVEAELRPAVPEVARAVANDLFAEWLDFQRKYQQVLGLASESPQFRALLSDAGDLGHLATLVDVMLTTVGRSGFDAALADGNFQRLMNLPPAAVEILRSSGQVETPLAWVNVAGGQLEQVVALEIHKHIAPQTLGRDTLAQLLALEDGAAVARLILLEPEALNTLLRLASPTVRELAIRLQPAELAWLARYVGRLTQAQGNVLVAQVLQQPVLMDRLQDEAVMDVLARSKNLPRALQFLSTPADVSTLPGDVWTVMSGQAPARLFVQKYGMTATAGLVLGGGLVVLALVWSVLRWLTAPLVAVARIFRGPARRSSRDSRSSRRPPEGQHPHGPY